MCVYILYWLHHVACTILVPPAVEAWILNHWTTRKSLCVYIYVYIYIYIYFFFLIARIGLCDHAGWLGKSEMSRSGCQERLARNLWAETDAAAHWSYMSSFSGKPQRLLRPFN